MAWLTGYSRRQKIVIDSDAHISSNESNFSITIHIPSSNTDFWANDDGNGTYVRFTQSDGDTLLKFEVESFDGVGEDAWWHVKIPTLLAAANTEIYIYYEAAATSDGSDKENVWDSKYRNVLHFNQDKSEGAFDDSTSYNNDVTNGGTTDVAGKIDRGRYWDGIDDNMKLPDAVGLSGVTAQTIEGWVKFDNVTAGNRIITADVSDIEDRAFLFGFFNSKLRYFATNTFNAWDSFREGTTTLVTGTDYHVGGIFDGVANTLTVWLNGSVENGTLSGSVPNSIRDNSGPLGIGCRWNSAGTVAAFLANLNISELTVSDTNRSADWMAARCQSGLGTWLSFEAEEVFDIGGTIFRRRMEGY